MRISILTLFFFSLVHFLHAQPQHHQWVFGYNLQLDMGGAEPAPVLGSAMTSDEGIACIADADGDLLFYTNGERVWDRNHLQMPNGFGLAGHNSSSQSALIVPSPGDDGRYYIFTTPAQVFANGGIYDGLAWSMVDINSNGGSGDVVLKNELLVTPVVEKLTATRHANGMDVWVLVHGWNNTVFHAYLVTCTGVEGPVSSSAGRPYMADAEGSNRSAMGYMKTSPQGDRLASVWTHFNADGSHQSELDVLAFDPVTGVVSTWLGDQRSIAPTDTKLTYGVAFSPDGSKVYTTEYGAQSGVNNSSIFQYDLSAPDPMNTEIMIADENMYSFGSMQLAPDGRLMVAQLNNNNTMTRIGSPDLAGSACDVQIGEVAMMGGFAAWGLPNHWDTYPEIHLDPLNMVDTTRCDGEPVTLSVNWQHPFHPAQFLWSTGATTPSITVNASGLYSVQVITPCTTLSDTVRVNIGNDFLDLGPDLRICEEDTVVLRSGSGALPLEWSDGSTGDTLLVLSSGPYWAQRVDAAGCIARDTVVVEYHNCRCAYFLPNAFTPNDDGVNDEWGPRYDCELERYELKLFDRWGRPVFTTTDPSWTWDGTLEGQALPNSVLAYSVRYSWYDGVRERSREESGHVVVVR